MTDPAFMAALQASAALFSAWLPADLHSMGLWAVVLILSAVMALSLLMGALNKVSLVLLKVLWPAMALWLLQAAGIVDPPQRFIWENVPIVQEPVEPPRAWWSWWHA